MMAMTKTNVFIFYGILIVLLAAAGYMYGKKQGKAEIYGAGGAAGGALLSILLWNFWAKKRIEPVEPAKPEPAPST